MTHEESLKVLDLINFKKLVGTECLNVEDIYNKVDEIFPTIFNDMNFEEFYEYLRNRYNDKAWFSEEVIYYIKFDKGDCINGF